MYVWKAQENGYRQVHSHPPKPIEVSASDSQTTSATHITSSSKFCIFLGRYDDYDLTQGITTVKVCHDGGENGLGSFPRLNGSNILKGSDDASQASSRWASTFSIVLMAAHNPEVLSDLSKVSALN